MSAFGYCEWCRGERLRASLVRDLETGTIRCSNRAQCDVERRIRDAREAARLAKDAEDNAQHNSAEVVAEMDRPKPPPAALTAEERQRERARAREWQLRAEKRKAREAAKAAQPPKPPRPKRIRRRPPKPLSADELEAREQWLKAQQERHRAERKTGGQ